MDVVDTYNIMELLDHFLACVMFRVMYNKRNQECEGCKVDSPSQIRHQCVMMTEDMLFDEYFDTARLILKASLDTVWEGLFALAKQLKVVVQGHWRKYYEDMVDMMDECESRKLLNRALPGLLKGNEQSVYDTAEATSLKLLSS